MMGKRSTFDRKSKDFYETPLRAVEPLMPHLTKGRLQFIDPCCGNGNIAIHISHFRSILRWWDFDKFDYLTEKMQTADATKHHYTQRVNYFITNPPWNRKILHPIINNLAGQKPTWLLFDSDWMHTKQSAEYMKYCVKIISVGRVKWFPDSNSVGKDNCAWYLFDKNFTGETVFIGR